MERADMGLNALESACAKVLEEEPALALSGMFIRWRKLAAMREADCERGPVVADIEPLAE